MTAVCVDVYCNISIYVFIFHHFRIFQFCMSRTSLLISSMQIRRRFHECSVLIGWNLCLRNVLGSLGFEFEKTVSQEKYDATRKDLNR